MQRLTPGHDFASRSARQTFGDVTVVRCAYAAAAKTPRHLHVRPYFGVVLAGRFSEIYGSRTIEAGRDEIAFHPADDGHTTYLDAGLQIIRVELGPRFTSGETRTLLDREATVLPHVRGDTSRRLVEECRKPDALTSLVLESLSLELIAQLARSRDDHAAPPWVARIRQRLRDEFTRQHTLADLAGDAGVHPAHVARAFRRYFGTTVGEVIRAERIAFARRALISGQPLVDIALAAGFSSQSHFSTSFRRATGQSPAAYRRRCQSRTKM